MFYWLASGLRFVIAAAALVVVEAAFPGQVDVAPVPMVALVLGFVLAGFAFDSRGISTPFSRGVRDFTSSLVLLTGTRLLPGGGYVSFWASIIVAFLIGLAAMFLPTRVRS